jgi:TolB-like protein/class 3 adenylate cyclase
MSVRQSRRTSLGVFGLTEERLERRLAAILAADVAGYSRLMGEEEAGTLTRLRAHRRELIDPKIAEHKGRIVKTTGDGLLVEFPSVVEAVACAVEVQRGMIKRNMGTPEDQRIEFRIGINLGDVILEDGDIYGDGVNVAARLEALADPGGICVSAAVHDQVQGRLESEFVDIGEQSLKNIARPMRVYRVRDESAASLVSAPTPTLAIPDKPSIAVLPFQNMSGDPEQEYFADGMVEEIITALSRIRWLFVIARNSTFTYKGRAVDVKQVGRDLGVRYVLEGSVRKGGNRVRITGQLIETETGAHLWADRFDGSLEDVFELQDQIATRVAGVIEPALQAAETRRSAARPTSDLTAYDLYLRGYAMFFRGGRQIIEALRLFERAIERDPDYGAALAWAAVCSMRLYVDGTGQDRDADRRNGIDFARRALRVAGDDPATLANAALALAAFGENNSTMVTLVERALALNPSFARGWYISAILKSYVGQNDVAIEHAEASLRLSPRGRFGTVFWVIGGAHFFSRRFDKAVPKLLLAIQDNPEFTEPYRYLAACYAHMGCIDEAREVVARLRAFTAVVMPNAITGTPDQRELLLSGLRQAMGEIE